MPGRDLKLRRNCFLPDALQFIINNYDFPSLHPTLQRHRNLKLPRAYAQFEVLVAVTNEGAILTVEKFSSESSHPSTEYNAEDPVLLILSTRNYCMNTYNRFAVRCSLPFV
jgi:hypothetical protein